MASSTMLMLAFHGLLLAPQVSSLLVSTDERQTQRRAEMDAKGRMKVKPQQTIDARKVKADVQNKYPFYHTTDEIKSEAVRLSKNCNGRLNFTSVTDNGVNLDVITVRKPEATPVNKVFLLFGEHARELISPESGIYFLRALCGDVEMKIPAMKSFLKESSTAEQALNDSEFMMVLNSNPGSRQKVENGDYCLRVSPGGVDLNRNWDEHYEGTSSTFGGDSNPGAKPFSEPETRIVKQLVTEYKPTTFLTVHSGTRGMYMPWAFDREHMATTNADSMMEVLKGLDEEHCQCPYGAAGAEVGYPCPGTCLDYAYAKLNTPFAFAFEIYVGGSTMGSDDGLKRRWEEKLLTGGAKLLETGHNLGHPHFRDIFDKYGSDFVGSSSLLERGGDGRDAQAAAEHMSNDGCFSMFNPSDKDEYQKVVHNWAETYFQMSSMIAQKLRSGEVKAHPKVAEPTDSDGGAGDGNPKFPVQ